ncbi:MAG: zinc-dependent metalloprotease [Polyangiales bacterium]
MSKLERVISVWTAALLLGLGLGACAPAPEPVNRVQTNLVDKAIFEGEWWYTSTSVDVDFDETFVFNTANAGAPFNGSMSTDFALDYNRGGSSVLGEPAYSFPIARIRWVIDERFLFAYRSYELVSGGNPDGREDEFRGQPLAVFKIVDHVDVRQDYSPVTGEKTNVTVENKQDQRWFERKFIRVDWSQNLLTQFAANDVQSNGLFTSFRRESVPFFIQEGSHQNLPSSYQPQFVRVADDESYARKGEWSDEHKDTVHYMSFVTQEVWSPAGSCLQQGGGVCASVTATMRNAFLRIPDGHEYAAGTLTNAEFDRFGIFRSHQETYAAGGQDRAVQRKHCSADADCGVGGACDTAERRSAQCSAAGKAADCRKEENICVGGLTADLGETDFLSFYTSRLNFFEDALTDKACVESWECDGRYTECASGDAKCLAAQASVCDPAARRCTTPLSQRKKRPVVYHLSPHFPPYLVRQTFEAVAEWNASLMKAHRAALGILPIDQASCAEGVCTTDLNETGRVTCQNTNPTAFCFCGSPDDKGGSCKREYDPFETPEQAQTRGVPNPYDCYLVGPADQEHPENYTDYHNDESYGYSFRGTECLLELAANSCDLDPEQPCEELGDLRYNFINHLQHGGANFGGVAQPLSDPKSGELVTTSATLAAESIESMGTLASQFFPVLRGEASEDSYFTGDNLRGYFAALGKVEHPVTTVPTTSEGNVIRDSGRPERAADVDDEQDASKPDVNRNLKARFAPAFARAQRLKGSDGRASILSDRTVKLRSSPIASQLTAALASEFPDARSAAGISSVNGPTSSYQSVTDVDGAQQELERERQRKIALGARNMDIFEAPLFNSQYMRYYAERFRGRSAAEASLRMQQAYYKGVTLHEIGHVLGLRHNFAGSVDRNNYHDGYYAIGTVVPLPTWGDYDDPANGGDGDGFVAGEEADRFANDTRAAREERLKSGAGTVMTASIMDYNGDLSDFAGLGRYDHAAVAFEYFDKVEAYQTGNPQVDPSVTDDAVLPGAFIGLERPDLHRRELWSYYRGGESCQADLDCPHSAGRESTAFQTVTQRCVVHPRLSQAPGSACNGGEDCVCSNLYEDFDAYRSGAAYRTQFQTARYAPVKYLYCHDNRVGDLSWCTRSDAGESFSEVIEHYRRSWRERYPRTYFRHFSAAGPEKGGSYSSVIDAVKIYQHMFFRQGFEGPEFTDSVAPLGFQDQILASAATLDWLAEIIGAPDVGSYTLDTRDNVYRQVSRDPNDGAADLGLPIGQGMYLWSEYQTGQNGFFRLERAGTFLDKVLAIQALTKRDWGLSYQVDEFYYVNFFDFFQREIVDLFGGLIMRNPRQYAPRFRSGESEGLEYLSSFRRADRGNQDTTYPAPAVDGVDSETLRDIATIQALAEFPVYYDTSFEQRLLVFKLGSGDGYKIPETRRDGTPTCSYGADGCDKPDYIVYDSDRLHTSYVAVVIDPEETNQIDEQQVAFQLLRRLTERQSRIRALNESTDRTEDESNELRRISADLQRDESFLEYLIELERQLGISSYFF